MANAKLELEAINISSDIEDLFESYEIENLNEIDEVRTFVSKIEDLKRNFRRIHAQLRVAEGENYSVKYPEFEKQVYELTFHLKAANEKLTALKKFEKGNLESERLKSKMYLLEERKLQNTSERSFLMEQINWDLQNCKWGMSEPNEIKDMISKLESRLLEFCKICSNMKGLHGEEVFNENFSEENERIISSIREKINEGYQRSSEIKIEKELFLQEKLDAEEKRREIEESERLRQIEIEEINKIDNLLACAKNLFFEIKLRHDVFIGKSKYDISSLSDYELLDLKKREESFQGEVRELIDKISSFEKFVIPCGDEASDLKAEVINLRDNCTDTLHLFLKDLNFVISDRDVSEKKLQNAAGLKINLTKFKGYDSIVDIFTFRSEFKKLIEPFVQKSLWADYLKKNFLVGPAYNLVAKIDSIDKIWAKLFDVYGNTQLLLQNKIGSLGKFSNLEKLRDDEKIANTITNLLNVMSDLEKLARDYDLEGDLYYGGGLQKVLTLIGNTRERNFIKSIAKKSLKNNEKWEKLIDFLNAELKEREAFILYEKSKSSMNLEGPKVSNSVKEKESTSDLDKRFQNEKRGFIGQTNPDKVRCHVCGKHENHIVTCDNDGQCIILYIACKTFVDLKPRDRDKLLYNKRFCSKCLSPGVKWNSEHFCDKTYTCGRKYEKNGKEFKCEKHVLTCGYHCSEKSNEELLQKYKKNVIINGRFDDFTKQIKISFFSEIHCNETKERSSIFAFQTVPIGGLQFNIFYDSGCGDLVVTKDTVEQLSSKGLAKQEFAGPIVLHGVGNQTTMCEYGIYSISLPLASGYNARMSGVCVEGITVPFPKYPLQSVEKDFREKIAETNPDILSSLPKLPKYVGGKVDIMIGKQYLKYFPKEIARLESGLTLYESCFKSPDGTNGVISGPHPEFSKLDRSSHFSEKRSLLNSSVENYNRFVNFAKDVPLLGSKGSLELFDSSLGDFTESLFVNDYVVNQEKSSNAESLMTFPGNLYNPEFFDSCSFSGDGVSMVYGKKRGPKTLTIFEKIENSGTSQLYRCPKCRNCSDCKNGCEIDDISIKEEIEQDLINKSVIVNTEKRISIAKLPFMADPDVRLKTNLKTARKVYDAQVRKLAKSEKDRSDVIEAEGKLQKLGFVDYLDKLEKGDQDNIMKALVQYFIPWRVVWSDSITTPVRPVFDGTFSPLGECSLNDILAKGTNNMNSLIMILIRWRTRLWGFHTDITKMYNAVRLDKAHWRYQLYLWQPDLDPNIEPKIKVIKTCIYGMKSSGNQAERAVRLTAEKNIAEFPIAHEIILRDLMVDDCISGKNTHKELLSATDELKLSLEKGGFTLKGFTFSGEHPDDNLSGGKNYITVVGLKWYPKEDFLMLNIDKLNFAKKIRGRKCDNLRDIPVKLTMTDCVGKVSELFDPLGRFVPLIASMKLDISHLHRSGITWNDQIPSHLRSVWESNFGVIEEMRDIRFSRAVVPIDAKNLDIVTLDTADASAKLICAAIYARFERKDGSYSCQLIFSRSKVLPEDISTPRAELMAAVMNTATGHTVKKAFGDLHKKAIKFSDSMVALHWISSQRTSLKTWVRNRVIEINRLCNLSDWRYVKSSDMIADLGTRQNAKISDIVEGSDWVNGLPWMSLPECDFPTKTIEEIKMSSNDSTEISKEMVVPKTYYSHFNCKNNERIDQEVKSRYTFSRYLVDPNKFRFRKIVRIMALILQFIYKISKNIERILQNKMFTHEFPYDLPKLFESIGDRFIVTSALSNSNTLICAGGKVVELSNFFLKAALFYFSIKTSLEVKHFLRKREYCNITKEIDGVLYYSGRILPDYSFGGYPELCEAAIDLCRTTFCVPVVDQYSPVAISIAMEIHWHHPDVQHTGIESMLRQTQTVVHIIEGRNLTKFIKQGCYKCRILNKSSTNALMGPIQKFNLCIAPAFFASQIDIFGPFKSFSNINKRATIKVWFLIFCCCTTGAIDIRVMDDYSTDSFILSFIRFSCRFGYPLYLLPDAGSQLIKGCENMSYSFTDCKQKLYIEYGVQYLPCPVGAHYVHGKVERKIREVKKCVSVHVHNERLSTIQWETLMQQISNSINNLPIGLKNKTENLENLDILTPNRLILGRNNERCPNSPLIITGDYKRVIEANTNIFKAWFKAWLVSFVPSLIERPKWHKSDENLKVGDVVLFLKSEKEYDKEYQYGLVSSVKMSRDGKVREVEIEYMNYNESVKRQTKRGVRDLVVIHPMDELSIYERLDKVACE